MRRATAALVLAAGLVLSGCSSSDDGEAEDTAGQSSTPSPSESPSEEPSETPGGEDVAAADVPALALGEGDFPAPYTYVALPPGALEKGTEAVGGVLKGATYDPAECGTAASVTSSVDLAGSGVAVAADKQSGANVVELVTPATTEIPDFEELADTCKTFSFTLENPGGAGTLKGDATVELLDAPDVEADRVQASSTEVTVTVAGQQQVVASTVYVAELRGVVVVVTGTDATGAGVDTAVLGQLLEAGVAKVAAA